MKEEFKYVFCMSFVLLGMLILIDGVIAQDYLMMGLSIPAAMIGLFFSMIFNKHKKEAKQKTEE